MNATLHARLGRGDLAFIKVRKCHSSFGTFQMQPFQTPNYGLEPSDIKRVDLGPPCTDHITLQQLVAPEGADLNNLAWFLAAIETRRSPADLEVRVPSLLTLGAHLDVQFRGSPPPSPPSPSSQSPPPPSRPPALILDYAYGIAAFGAWRSRRGGEVHAIMRNYRGEQYAHIPPLPRQVDDFGGSDNEAGADDEDDRDRDPTYNSGTSLRKGDTIAEVMDELNSVLMGFHGITPQEAAIRREKRMKEEELMAQEAGRSKVVEWMKTTAVGGSL